MVNDRVSESSRVTSDSKQKDAHELQSLKLQYPARAPAGPVNNGIAS